MATPKPAKAASPFVALADELGALEKEMAPHSQKLSRIEQLKKALRAGCTAKPEEPWTINGERFVAVLGPCGDKRVVDYKALVKAITAATFAKFATCTLIDLEKHVAPAIVAAVVTSGASGPRSLKTFEKGNV